MKPRITVITLAVEDLARSVEFYRNGLGLPTEGIIGQEFEYGAVAFFDLESNNKLALWPRQSLAQDSGLALEKATSPAFSLGHNVASRNEVDSVMLGAERAGAKIVKAAAETFYGGYAGYFKDPDGHLWEVAWNPAWNPVQTPPLTRSVGAAERSMRALLERTLQGANLSFPEWTVLAFTSASPLESDQVVQRQMSGHVVSDAAGAQRAVDTLFSAGLIEFSSGNLLAHTEKGAAVFQSLSSKVENITRALYGDLPIADLEATHRTLVEIAKRANNLLSQGA